MPISSCLFPQWYLAIALFAGLTSKWPKCTVCCVLAKAEASLCLQPGQKIKETPKSAFPIYTGREVIMSSGAMANTYTVVPAKLRDIFWHSCLWFSFLRDPLLWPSALSIFWGPEMAFWQLKSVIELLFTMNCRVEAAFGVRHIAECQGYIR